MSSTNKLVVMAAPEAMMSDANWLMVVLGNSHADIDTFVELNFAKPVDPENPEAEVNAFSVRSIMMPEATYAKLSQKLVAPSFWPDADVAAATRARDAMVYTGEAVYSSIVSRVDVPVAQALVEFVLEPYEYNNQKEEENDDEY